MNTIADFTRTEPIQRETTALMEARQRRDSMTRSPAGLDAKMKRVLLASTLPS